ncbi:MAG: DsrE family protein [Deltaproteobacteria bacterium]|nr:DsrE family protein [Deltaproteobacteria bacterium]
MNKKTHLYVLWTNDNPITAEKMVFMYPVNSLINGWWGEVTLIIWGAPAKLVSEDCNIQKMVKKALKAGVHITACKACADQLGVTETLEKLDIEVKYWGIPLTEILKNEETLLTI